MESYTINGQTIKENKLLRRVVATQKEMINYERGKKLSLKVKSRLDRARDTLAVARYCYLDDPKRGEKMEAAAKVIEAVEDGGIQGVAYRGITGITG